ncbi:MAG: HAD family hydrolase [Bacteroidales bacterium]|jgi:D-glycero-D-manno-heptose 1,7-bisphosphate phosphatase|nr:HAD family hydrolase [Bacteroidales bacterium]
MNKAVFLDRDGVINDGTLYYTYKVEDFRFNTDVFESLQLLVKAGYLLIVVSNQGGVAKGIYTENDVNKVHEYMRQELLKHNIPLSGIYYCPHHSNVSNCDCRKPKPGMLLQAIKDLNIDPRQSFMIGDSKRDIEAANAAGVQGVLIEKNGALMPYVQQIVE